MSSLTFLDISDNRLSSLYGLDSCKKLLELTVDENRIARIGKNITPPTFMIFSIRWTKWM